MTLLKRLVREDDGATMVEYALMVVLIAIVAIGAVTLAGEQIAAIFDAIAAALTP